jgi:hypothetical protein
MKAQTPRASPWMSGALLVALLIAAGTLWHFGIGDKGTYTAIRLTARWSYGFFLLAYTGGPLAVVFGPAFQPLARRGRELGLAFAAAHLVHVGLVAWLYHISRTPPIPTSAAVFFGVALGFTYLIALLSIPRLASALPRWLWRTIVIVGMEFIALAFLRDFLRYPFGHGIARILFMLPFTVLAIAAALLRITSYALKLRLSLRHSRAIPL